MSREHAALAARIGETLLEIERVVDRAERLAEKALRTGDDGFWDGVALNVHAFYAGVEHLFEDIARTLEASVPEGGDWHRDLLLQMSADVSGVRPAVLARDTRQCLEEYRGFRHVVRNVYTFSLRPSRLPSRRSDAVCAQRNSSRWLNTNSPFVQTRRNQPTSTRKAAVRSTELKHSMVNAMCREGVSSNPRLAGRRIEQDTRLPSSVIVTVTGSGSGRMPRTSRATATAASASACCTSRYCFETTLTGTGSGANASGSRTIASR